MTRSDGAKKKTLQYSFSVDMTSRKLDLFKYETENMKKKNILRTVVVVFELFKHRFRDIYLPRISKMKRNNLYWLRKINKKGKTLLSEEELLIW